MVERYISAHTSQRKFSFFDGYKGTFYYERSDVMNLDEIFSFDNLYEAHKDCRRSKQHIREIISFELNLSSNIAKLVKALKNKTYKFGKYYSFYIYEPKERLIEALPYKDRVVIKCFCNVVLIPKLKNKLINDNVACRKGKGTLYGIKRLEIFLKREYSKNKTNEIYYLKCDIKKYFPSINHEILLNLLSKLDFSDDEIWFIKKTINEQPSKSAIGLPLGNQTSQWYALLYLNNVDRLIKEKLRIKGYVRYMDDMILLHKDKSYLRFCKDKIEKMCKENLALELNKKTQIGKVKYGIDFLGFRHILTKTGKVVRKLRKSSKIRLKHHLKILSKLKNKEVVDKDYVLVRKNAYYAHILYSSEKRLIKSLHDCNKNI